MLEVKVESDGPEERGMSKTSATAIATISPSSAFVNKSHLVCCLPSCPSHIIFLGIQASNRHLWHTVHRASVIPESFGWKRCAEVQLKKPPHEQGDNIAPRMGASTMGASTGVLSTGLGVSESPPGLQVVDKTKQHS